MLSLQLNSIILYFHPWSSELNVLLKKFSLKEKVKYRETRKVGSIEVPFACFGWSVSLGVTCLNAMFIFNDYNVELQRNYLHIMRYYLQ